jgi:hypothetical protein
MKLYPKKLSSLEELKREKQELKARLAKTNEEGFFSMTDVLPSNDGKNEEEDDEAPLLSKLTDTLNNTGAMELISSIGGPLLGIIGEKIERKTMARLAKEVLGGYAKWKAIELIYRGVKMLVEKQKEKNESK